MSERKKQWAVKIDDDYFYAHYCRTRKDTEFFRDELHHSCGYKLGKVVRVLVSIEEVKPSRK